MHEERKQTNWRLWGVAALIALVLIVALLIAVGIGALIGYLAPVVRRHRRQGARGE